MRGSSHNHEFSRCFKGFQNDTSFPIQRFHTRNIFSSGAIVSLHPGNSSHGGLVGFLCSNPAAAQSVRPPLRVLGSALDNLRFHESSVAAD